MARRKLCGFFLSGTRRKGKEREEFGEEKKIGKGNEKKNERENKKEYKKKTEKKEKKKMIEK